MKRPAFQFYPGDWLRDTALRTVSVGARGAWIDMICLMHDGTPYGHLKVNHKVILPVNLARILGATLPEVEGWLVELLDAGVYSVGDDGGIYSRRMIRDEELRETRANAGKLGGNPALLLNHEVNHELNHEVNHPPNLGSENKVNHLPTPSSSSSSSSSEEEKRVTKKKRTPKPKAPELTDGEWLESLKSLPENQRKDVGLEYGKMLAWCERKRETPTRRRFEVWLSRCEAPLELPRLTAQGQPFTPEPLRGIFTPADRDMLLNAL